MVDALAPATGAFTKGDSGGGRRSPAPLSALADAACAGAMATISMQGAQRTGRGYLGPRSVGHEDPGAASTALILGRPPRRSAGGPMTQPMTPPMSEPSSYPGACRCPRGWPPGSSTPATTTPANRAPARSATPGRRWWRGAFAAVARERSALAGRLREAGRGEEGGHRRHRRADRGRSRPGLSRPWRRPGPAGTRPPAGAALWPMVQAAAIRRAVQPGPGRPGPGDVRQVASAVLAHSGGQRPGTGFRPAASSWSGARSTRPT